MLLPASGVCTCCQLDQFQKIAPAWPCRFTLVEHAEPRYSAFADAEAQSTLVWVTYKHDRKEVVR